MVTLYTNIQKTQIQAGLTTIIPCVDMTAVVGSPATTRAPGIRGMEKLMFGYTCCTCIFCKKIILVQIGNDLPYHTQRDGTPCPGGAKTFCAEYDMEDDDEVSRGGEKISHVKAGSFRDLAERAIVLLTREDWPEDPLGDDEATPPSEQMTEEERAGWEDPLGEYHDP